MKFICANANLVNGVNLDTDYDYKIIKGNSLGSAIGNLGIKFIDSNSDCLFIVWDTDDPYDLVRATEDASMENVNFKKTIDELKHQNNNRNDILYSSRTITVDEWMITIVVFNLDESKKSIRKSMKESKSEDIAYQCKKILNKYGAEFSKPTVETIDGTTYVVFKYYGGTNDTIDRNDDSWDDMMDIKGVVDVGYGYGYGLENTKWEDSLLIELDESITESKKSIRKSMKEGVAKEHKETIIEDVAERLKIKFKNCTIQVMCDNEKDCFIDIVDKNQETNNSLIWTFDIDYETNEVWMLEPREKNLGKFKTDYEIYNIIVNNL